LLWLGLGALALAGCGNKKAKEADNLVRFSAAGDLMLDRGVRVWVDKNGPAYPFQPVAAFLQSRQFVAANFEMALDHGCQALAQPEVFRLPEAYLPELRHSGLNLLNLANDHTLDCGREALGQAVRWMLATGIQPLGAGDSQTQAQQPVYLTEKGITLSLLSFNLSPIPGAEFCRECTGPAFYEPAALSRYLAEMSKRSDFRLVFFHWGETNAGGLRPDPKAVAREAINFGADLVIGFGPEGPGGLERVRGKWVIGSLGNFVSDPTTPQGREGLLLCAEFAPRRIMNLRLLPLHLAQGQVSFARGPQAQALLQNLIARSESGSRSDLSLVEDILYLR
jgi:poly-gamma-glutamate synthesis protein (capsule biosynthesis protein)